MANAPDLPLALDELSWIDVAAHLARDARLIIPVGALEQHGPHLPLGSNVLIARSLAVDLSGEFGVLRAPTMYYGVNVRTERAFAGTASLVTYVIPVFSTVLGVTVLGETLHWNEPVGTVVLLAGVAISQGRLVRPRLAAASVSSART